MALKEAELKDTMSAKNEEIKDIFTVDSHHMNISVFFLVQNLFQAEKNQRTISLNINYCVLNCLKRLKNVNKHKEKKRKCDFTRTNILFNCHFF